LAAVVAADETAPPPTLKDVIKDTLQDTIQDAIDGTLKDTLQEKVQQKVKDALVDTPQESSDGSLTQTKVVLQISKEFIQQHLPPAVEQDSLINRLIEATYRSRLDRLATPPRLRRWIVRRFAGPQIE
jgi:transposase